MQRRSSIWFCIERFVFSSTVSSNFDCAPNSDEKYQKIIQNMKKKKKIEIVKPLTRFFGLWLLCKKSCWQDWALEGWMLKMRFWTQNKISNFSYLYFSLIFEQISGTPDWYLSLAQSHRRNFPNRREVEVEILWA